jgi:hypothetical protein
LIFAHAEKTDEPHQADVINRAITAFEKWILPGGSGPINLTNQFN